MNVHHKVRKGIICEIRTFTSHSRKEYTAKRGYDPQRTKRERKKALEHKNKILSVISQYINDEQLEYLEEQRPQGHSHYTYIPYYTVITAAIEEISIFHKHKFTNKKHTSEKPAYDKALKLINQFEEIKISSNYPKSRGEIFTELFKHLEDLEMNSENIKDLYNTIKSEFDYKDNSNIKCDLHSNRLPQRETHRNKSWDFLKDK